MIKINICLYLYVLPNGCSNVHLIENVKDKRTKIPVTININTFLCTAIILTTLYIGTK